MNIHILLKYIDLSRQATANLHMHWSRSCLKLVGTCIIIWQAGAKLIRHGKERDGFVTLNTSAIQKRYDGFKGISGLGRGGGGERCATNIMLNLGLGCLLGGGGGGSGGCHWLYQWHRWYYGFSITAAASTTRRPWRCEHSNSKNIQSISFKFYLWVDTPLRYFAIEIWYSPRTRTTAFAAKRHSYPPNLQNAVSPLLH